MQPNSPSLPGARSLPWYRHRWPWFLMLGPVLVMVATAVSAWLALQTPDALVVGDYYKQGKAINQDLRRDRVASGLRLSFQMGYDEANGKLHGRLQSFGRPMATPLRVLLAHPTQPSKDLALDVQPDADGRFAVDLPALERSHWQVVVEGDQRGWRLARSWELQKGGELAIEADPL